MPLPTHITFLVFCFVLGSCVGSFLNVVVWRLPQVPLEPTDGFFRTLRKSMDFLSNPPSHCPKCNERLRWYDNVPVIGWIKLRGKCRFCGLPISPRYPIVEFLTGVLFAFYYAAFFMWHWGPCEPVPFTIITHDWPVFALILYLLGSLLAASLIDAEHFMIPQEITVLVAVLGFAVHTVVDSPTLPGSLIPSPVGAAVAAFAGVGLLISLILRRANIFPKAFPDGEPLLEVDKQAMKEAGEEIPKDVPVMTGGQVRLEILKELLFITPPLMLGLFALFATVRIPALNAFFASLLTYDFIPGFLGALLGALVGGFVIWITRILGSLAFGRVAMGLGDADLMFAVGACVGPGPTTIAFFIAPFFGIVFAVYFLVTGKRREMPFGPYLSLGTATVLLTYCPIANYLAGGMQGLQSLLTVAP